MAVGMPFARKKPLVIEYRIFDGTNYAELDEWTGGLFRLGEREPGYPKAEAEVFDKLHRTWVTVFKGQIVIKGVEGEFYPHATDLFYENYDLL